MVDQDGYIAIPLYHGTSSIFRASIEKNGLGGVRDSGIFDIKVLASLAEMLKKTENKTTWWAYNSFIVEAMLNQEITRGGFNFRYGGVYLSPSKHTARRYANNAMGSELLSTIYQAYSALISVNTKAAKAVLPDTSPISKLFKQHTNPLILTVTRVSAEALTTENGQPIQAQLAVMESMKIKYGATQENPLFQQMNFVLTETLHPDLLQFEQL